MFNRARAAFTSITGNTRYAFNTALTFVIGGSLSTTANAAVCFEDKGHDYTLNCVGNELSLLQKMADTCGTYIDQWDDCARYFIDTTHYGKGTFGGTCCDLSYHTVGPDACLDQLLNDNVSTCYGTANDVFATIGIIIGGLVVICCITAGAAKVFCARDERVRQPDAPVIEGPSPEQMLNEHLLILSNGGHQVSNDRHSPSAPPLDAVEEANEEGFEPGGITLEGSEEGMPSRTNSLLASASALFGKKPKPDTQGVALTSGMRSPSFTR